MSSQKGPLKDTIQKLVFSDLGLVYPVLDTLVMTSSFPVANAYSFDRCGILIQVPDIKNLHCLLITTKFDLFQ